MHPFSLTQATRESLHWDSILISLEKRAATERGKAQLRHLPFLADATLIEQSFLLIGEGRSILTQDEIIPIDAIADITHVLKKAQKGAVLFPEEILANGKIIHTAIRVKSFLKSRQTLVPRLHAIALTLANLSHLASRIDDCLEADGSIKDTASEALMRYRQRARQLHAKLKKYTEGLLQNPNISPYLQDTFYSIRNDRYVVPIQSSFRSRVPGIVHNASNSGQTLFIEPQQLVDMGNELSIAESLGQEEERQILTELSNFIGNHAEDLHTALNCLSELDCIQAKAQLSSDLDAHVPSLKSFEQGFILRDARHPLLVLQGKNVVANTIQLEPSQKAMVISGPNAGGKTVTISTVGLCALLIRAGLPIPAHADSICPLYSGCCTAIGDDQDLANDLSTFSAHLIKLKTILNVATQNWLVLIDEIAADTDPKEGAALATAILEELVKKDVQVLVTTHLDEIKALSLTKASFTNARVGYNPETFAPNYTLELGAAGVSNALDLAEKVGIAKDIIISARKKLTGQGALSLALAQLEKERRIFLEQQQKMKQAAEYTEEERKKWIEAKNAAQRAQRDARQAILEEMADSIKAVQRDIKQTTKTLQQKPSISETQSAKKVFDAHAQKIKQAQVRLENENASPDTSPVTPVAGSITVGTVVKAMSLGQKGMVMEINDQFALVQFGALQSRLQLSDLILLQPAPSSKHQSRLGQNQKLSGRVQTCIISQSSVDTQRTECDVRGLRVDEAVNNVEKYLDACALNNAGRVSIIHGHGTGALKQAIRQAVQRLPYVEHFRPGSLEEGGDGVTIIDLASKF